MADNNPTVEEISQQEELDKQKKQETEQNNEQEQEQDSDDDFQQSQVADEENYSQDLDRAKQTSLKEKLAKIQQLKGGVDQIQETQQKLKRLKNFYRIINGTSAVTVVGVIITWLVMNGQLILGNVFNFKFIPKLDWWEIGIVLLLDILVAVALFLLFFIIYLQTHPCEGLRIVNWNWLADLCGDVTGTAP